MQGGADSLQSAFAFSLYSDLLAGIIAKRLELKFHKWAAAVLAFDVGQMNALCDHIRETHFLIRP
jgi:hypothetical protein